MEKAPKIRILHQLARSGGTVICKCLATMDRVNLLSEIHPLGTEAYNPLTQAMQWFDLLTSEDLQELRKRQNLEFCETFRLIDERCRERGKILLIRDWTHFDFTGVPYLDKPTYRLLTADVLARQFDVVNHATVRHPVDQWLSLSSLPLMKGKITLPQFLDGYRRFSEKCVEIGFARYEDFLRDPDGFLEGLCGRLDIPFDPDYKDRWAAYNKITGDVTVKRWDKIAPPRRLPFDRELLRNFEENRDYRRSLTLLGYRHPEE